MLGDLASKLLAVLMSACLGTISISCAGSGSVPGCRNAVAPKLVSSVDPKVPEGFWKTHRDGAVVVETTIGADGSVSVVSVISSSGREYTALAVEAIRKWRYSPLTCDGAATPMTLEVTVRFSNEVK
jgi:TonB family protein